METRKAISVLEIPEKYDYTVGQDVLAIGTPLGLKQSLTRGIISGIDRILPVSPMSLAIPMIQTDAAINPGNSGGPLLDNCGRAIGITTSKLVGVDNIGFALPATVIRQVLPQLLSIGRIPRPWIGLRGQFIEQKQMAQFFNIALADGFLVEAVEPDSPAMKAGLQGGLLPVSIGDQSFLFGGDVITGINGTTFTDETEFHQRIQQVRIGDPLVLEYVREGKRGKARIKVIERPVLPMDIVSQ
jgi:S1-C subfamily serine protease